MFLFSMILIPPRSTLSPYTTPFRSQQHRRRRAGSPGRLEELAEPEDVGVERRRRPVGPVVTPDGLDQGVHADGVTGGDEQEDRKSTRLNSSHAHISYDVLCLNKTEM